MMNCNHFLPSKVSVLFTATSVTQTAPIDGFYRLASRNVEDGGLCVGSMREGWRYACDIDFDADNLCFDNHYDRSFDFAVKHVVISETIR